MNSIVIRQWFNNKIYPFLFSLCIIVSLGAYLTLDVLQFSVNSYINDNQKQIVGGDIIITSKQDWSDAIKRKIKQLTKKSIVFDYQFNAIAYTKDASILTRIKGVTKNYPLYGNLALKNNTSQWQLGSVLVEQQILHQLSVEIGDSIKIGESYFTIHDEIISEPDRPLTAFGFGARVIMHASDLVKTQLMGKKSRINYRIEIKSNDQNRDALMSQLNAIVKNQVQYQAIEIKTAEQSNTSISILSQNFLIFLKILVLAVLILSATGIMSIIRSFVESQQNTNAIRISLGEKSQSVVKSYRLLLFLMVLFSVMLAGLVAQLILHFGQGVFSAILPVDIALNITWWSLAKALFVALVITYLSSFFSLKAIHQIKPIAVLHQHKLNSKRPKTNILWYFASSIIIVLLLYLEMINLKLSLVVFFGLIFIWLSFLLMIKLLMKFIVWLLRKKIINQWMLVLSLQNIFRKNNQSTLFITAISLTTMVLASIFILDYSINQQLIATYPKDAPNLFLLDVETKQSEQLDKLLGQKLTYYPVIRARIKSVNGVGVEELKGKLSGYDNISRIFNLSYSSQLMKTEEIESSNNGQLYAPVKNNQAVSILSSFAHFLQVGLGDEVVFNVQGIEIRSTITSIRKRLKKGPSPFFYFLFPPQVMKDAPQIRFATARVDDAKRIDIQTKIAQKFPGITTIDGASIAKKLKIFVDQLTQLIKIFTALSLIAGLLIFFSSLLSTSQDRIRESFYYKLMGMQEKDIRKLSTIEFLFLGLFSFYIGLIVATITSYLMTNYWLSLAFLFPWKLFCWSNILLISIMLSISMIYSRHVNGTKIIGFLKHES